MSRTGEGAHRRHGGTAGASEAPAVVAARTRAKAQAEASRASRASRAAGASRAVRAVRAAVGLD